MRLYSIAFVKFNILVHAKLLRLRHEGTLLSGVEVSFMDMGSEVTPPLGMRSIYGAGGRVLGRVGALVTAPTPVQ